MNIVRWRKLNYVFSGTLVAASIAAIAVFGLRFGIDFTGGSLLEVAYTENRPASGDIEAALAPLDIGVPHLQLSGANAVLLRLRALNETDHQSVLTALRATRALTELRFDSIGPTIGKELQRKAVTAIILVIVMIILYITWAFRKVSRPLASWRYGLIAVAALAHDIIIPTGIFAVLGAFRGVEIDTLFVTALLTVLGFSIHDTIVVFDRTRENLQRFRGTLDFETIVGTSVRQTLSRSINTSLTTAFVLAALLFFGPVSTRYLSLALLLGIIFGTYSSIFIASPLLVSWNLRREKKQK